MRRSATRAVANRPNRPPKKIKRTSPTKAKQTSPKKIKRTSPKRITRTPPKSAKPTSIAAMQAQISALQTELQEARDQQTATAEVLGVINASPGDLAPVFDAILEKAHALCGIAFGSLQLYEDGKVRAVAVRAIAEDLAQLLRQPMGPRPGSSLSRLLAGERFVQNTDILEVGQRFPGDPRIQLSAARGLRTGLFVPLRKEGEFLGYISAFRDQVRPFSEKEIALLENFAAQAVIAMENARLITETREALEQQTATAEVLGVINASPGDLAPVFDAMLEKATRLCGAAFGSLLAYDGEHFENVALRNVPEAFAEFAKPGRTIAFGPGTGPYRLLAGEPFVHITDGEAEEAYKSGDPAQRALIDLAGARSWVTVPLKKDDSLLGSITVFRQEVRPFSQKEIALLQNFAAQAVIAMENARLLDELRGRTRDLQESLEYQTATSDVLKVISQTDADLNTVLQTALDTAANLCEADGGNIFLRRGEALYLMASIGASPQATADLTANPILVDRHTTSGRAVLTGEVTHISDITADPDYSHGATVAAGVRTMLGVPLLREDKPIGSISLARYTVKPFAQKQIELVRTFADQAVIAIENARLLGELRQRTEQVAELNRGLEARVTEQVEELGRVGRLKRFLAPQLAELIVSQGDEKILESHRREIVVVFCDLRGYTAFSEAAEPEEVLDFLREYHGALGPLVGQFEGTLDQFSGDGIMVFFNDPVPIPDPAERAVKMSVAMRQAAGTLIASWRQRGRKLGFGIGIAQGYATLGQIGFAERSGYTAIGTVCNVASRLCAEAKDGQILVAQRVAVAVGETVELEEIGTLTLKGLTQPVVAFNVLDRAAGGSAEIVSLPIRGRETQ